MVGTVGATAIVCFTASGSTARRLSRERPAVPLLVLTPSAEDGAQARPVVGRARGQDPRHRQFRGDDRQGQEDGAAPRSRPGRRPDRHHRRSSVRDPGIDQRHPYRPAGRRRAGAAQEGAGEGVLGLIPADKSVPRSTISGRYVPGLPGSSPWYDGPCPSAPAPRRAARARGSRSGRSSPPARRPASPWSQTPHRAAVSGSAPRAQRPPTIPASASPEPEVASPTPPPSKRKAPPSGRDDVAVLALDHGDRAERLGGAAGGGERIGLDLLRLAFEQARHLARMGEQDGAAPPARAARAARGARLPSTAASSTSGVSSPLASRASSNCVERRAVLKAAADHGRLRALDRFEQGRDRGRGDAAVLRLLAADRPAPRARRRRARAATLAPVAIWSLPAPARRPPVPASIAAPASSRLPAMTSSRPRSSLSLSSGCVGEREAAGGGARSSASGSLIGRRPWRRARR